LLVDDRFLYLLVVVDGATMLLLYLVGFAGYTNSVYSPLPPESPLSWLVPPSMMVEFKVVVY
jgi:hypothetical protein